MAAWLRLVGPAALALAPGPAAALHVAAEQSAQAYPPILSAAQDCLDSYKGLSLEQKQLKKRGWAKARIEWFDDLAGVVTPFVRSDGAIMLVTRYSCIVKARPAPPASVEALAEAISEKWSARPSPGAGKALVWLLAERKIELIPGPADGSNVSLTVSIDLDGIGR